MDTNQAFSALEQSLKLLGEEKKSWTWVSGKTKGSRVISNPRNPGRGFQFSYKKGPQKETSLEKIVIHIQQSDNKGTQIQVYEYERGWLKAFWKSILDWIRDVTKPHMIFTLVFIIIFAVFLRDVFNLIAEAHASENKTVAPVAKERVLKFSLVTFAEKENFSLVTLP